MLVSDQTCSFEPRAQRELPLKNGPRSRAQREPAILSCLGLVAVNPGDTRFVDTHDAVHEV